MIFTSSSTYVKPKLDRENWMSWKRYFIAVTKNRGLYKIITGADRMH
jgi:hypothetical protein